MVILRACARRETPRRPHGRAVPGPDRSGCAIWPSWRSGIARGSEPPCLPLVAQQPLDGAAPGALRSSCWAGAGSTAGWGAKAWWRSWVEDVRAPARCLFAAQSARRGRGGAAGQPPPDTRRPRSRPRCGDGGSCSTACNLCGPIGGAARDGQRRVSGAGAVYHLESAEVHVLGKGGKRRARPWTRPTGAGALAGPSRHVDRRP